MLSRSTHDSISLDSFSDFTLVGLCAQYNTMNVESDSANVTMMTIELCLSIEFELTSWLPLIYNSDTIYSEVSYALHRRRRSCRRKPRNLRR